MGGGAEDGECAAGDDKVDCVAVSVVLGGEWAAMSFTFSEGLKMFWGLG